jgi:hypothetical protein
MPLFSPPPVGLFRPGLFLRLRLEVAGRFYLQPPRCPRNGGRLPTWKPSANLAIATGEANQASHNRAFTRLAVQPAGE